MKNWLKNTFGKSNPKPPLEWQTEDSILAFLKSHLNADGTLQAEADTLPDEERADDEISFAAGLTDALVGADESKAARARIKRLLELITRVARNGDAQSKSDFYREITENESVIGIIDEYLEKLLQSALPVEPYLFDYAYQLMAKTPHRNAVKFGIAILALCQNKKPVDDLKVLGLHDEFTVFATLALVNLSDNLVDDLWQLARGVHGWGRIQLVDRLAEMDLPPSVRDWLVREGYRNSILYEYLALTCATAGQLREKLAAPTIDYDLFYAAGELIVALMDEGPAAGMSAYEAAEETIHHYLRHAQSQTLQVADLVALYQLKDYLSSSPSEREVLQSWDANELANARIDLNTILTSKDWSSEIKTALQSPNDQVFWNAKQVAHQFGFDLSDVLWKRLGQAPLDSFSWYDIITYAPPERPQQLVDKAIELLPLAAISPGPEDSMGLGPDWSKHQALGHLIVFLQDHPGVGEAIILAGLNSPAIGNRNATLRTLQAWTADHWTSAIQSELNKLRRIEPTPDTKADLVKLLNGQPID
ncbi:MAG: hypothetical protein AAFR05_16005 [Bacteroidota bacterium]